MDDIVDKFGKRRSPVLETTMFRAIARMIMKEGSSELLEQLHRLDQEVSKLTWLLLSDRDSSVLISRQTSFS